MSMEVLDTWIGFAMAMLLLSLLVTTVVSAVTIVGLRPILARRVDQESSTD